MLASEIPGSKVLVRLVVNTQGIITVEYVVLVGRPQGRTLQQRAEVVHDMVLASGRYGLSPLTGIPYASTLAITPDIVNYKFLWYMRGPK